jgi:WD40 repeat protein
MDEGTHQLLERAVVDVEPQRGLDDVKGRARQRHARGRLLAGITAAIVAIVGVGGVIALLNDGTPNRYVGVSPSPPDHSQEAAALRAKIEKTRLKLEALNVRVSSDLHRLLVAKQNGDLLGAQRISARLQVERAEVAQLETLMRHLMDRLHRLLVAPSGSPSAMAGPLIAFTTSIRGERIAVMRPDGSDVSQVTTGEEPDAYVERYGDSQDLNPQWSPNGATIYFLRRYSEAVYSLCSISPSGADFEILVRDVSSGEFALSPSGTHIAFAGDGGIRLMNVDGSGDHLLARFNGLPFGVSASWSPDGTRIAFVSGLQELWMVDVPNGRLTRVRTDGPVDAVLWSPKGDEIAIAMRDATQTFASQVWIIHSDGTGARRLTDGTGYWIPAAWSPDGSQLLLGRLDDRLSDDGQAVIDANGSGLVVVNPTGLSGSGSWRA